VDRAAFALAPTCFFAGVSMSDDFRLSLARSAGMYIAAFLLLHYQTDVLAFPTEAFRQDLKLFDGITDSGTIWQSLAVQVLFEIITDTVCMIFEARRGLNPVAVWRRLPKAQLCAGFMLMSVHGYIGGVWRTSVGDNMDACTNKDMCYCVNNGLRPLGIREAYCLLLYPNSSGAPGAATRP
jgi:hypothetical protein